MYDINKLLDSVKKKKLLLETDDKSRYEEKTYYERDIVETLLNMFHDDLKFMTTEADLYKAKYEELEKKYHNLRDRYEGYKNRPNWQKTMITINEDDALHYAASLIEQANKSLDHERRNSLFLEAMAHMMLLEAKSE